MKDNISHAVCRAALVSGLGVLCFGSAWADVPASAYVQNGLVVQYDAGSALSQDGKLTNLGTAGSAFDLTPVDPAKDKVADGWIHTETGWWMPSVAESAVLGAGYTIECYGSQTGIGSKDANYYFMVSTSVKDFSNTGSENIPISLGTAGVLSKGMIIGGLTETWSGNSYKPNGKLDGSVRATRAGTVDASGGKTIAYYEDGVVIGSSASAGTVNDGIKRVNLGDLRGQRGCYWIGDVGSVRIYNRRLTAEEIACNAAVDKVRFEGVDPATLTWPAGCRWNAEAGELEFLVNFASSDDSRGSVAAEVGGSAATSSFWYAAGSSVELMPTPASGYKFVRWTGDTDGVAVDAAGVATFSSAPRTLTAVFVPSSADPVDRSWSGSGDGKDWFDANNWQPAGVPAEGDSITIGTGKSIVLTNSTEELSSLTLASTLACSNWTTCIRAVDVKLLSGAVVKPICAFSNSDMSNRVWISATTLDIASGASINANGFGYKAKCGPGWDGVSASGCGGSHGGTGSDGKGKTYGSVTEPTDAGSGGYDIGSYVGQNGGGVVRVEATGAVVVDGTITATGSAGSYNQEAGAGGSVYVACQKILGAGRITADGGGNKTINNATAYVRAVGGGGRISVIYDPVSQATQPCDIAFSARGGADQGGSKKSQLSLFGQEGTLYFSDDAFAKRPLIKLAGRVYYGPEVTHLSSLSYPGDFAPADTLLVFEDGGEIDIGGDLVLTGNIARLYGIVDKGHAPTIRIGGDLVLAGASLRVMDCRTMTVGGDVRFVDGPNGMNRAELYFRAAATNGTDGAYGGVIDVAGDWTMGNYSVYTPSCNGGCGSIVRTTAASLTLTTTAKINANGEGYDGNTGPGRSNGSQSGSTHAGKGAGNASATYGNKKCPVTPGSGSGHPSYNLLKGGGVVLFETRGRMTLNGSVTANGVNSPQGNYSGSSAGGSVWLLCGTKLGGTNAVITANAGDSTWTSSSNYKGGGGGYVSIWYQSLSDDVADWTVTARGGMLTRETVRTSAWGEDGKTYWRQWHKGLMLFAR